MKPSLLWLTLLHLLVDGVCGAVLAVYALQEPRMAPIIYHFTLYTVFAFGLQAPVGWVLDKYRNFLWQSLGISVLLLVLGSLPQLEIFYQAVLLGLGNCLFHVAGGSYVLQQYTTYTQLGLFVSSGAIGLGLGLNSLVGVLPLVISSVVVGIMAMLCVKSAAPAMAEPDAEQLPAEHQSLELWGCSLLLLGCVLLRGFSGGAVFDISSLMLLPCLLALGKFAGGVVCDRLGFRKTVLLIFLLGFAALQLRGDWSLAIFIISCNMTMPLTLRLVHWCRWEAPGLMFGLAAGCLVPGVVCKNLFQPSPQLVIVLQFLILVLAGYVLLERGGRHA